MHVLGVTLLVPSPLLLLKVLRAADNEDTFLWKKHFASSPIFFSFAHSKKRFGKQHFRNKVSSLDKDFKVHMTRNFLLAYSKSFQNDEEWRLFYCDSTFGCRVIQDFGLCKLDD